MWYPYGICVTITVSGVRTRNVSRHWNATVRGLTEEVSELYKVDNPRLWDKLSAEFETLKFLYIAFYSLTTNVLQIQT